MTKNFDPEIGKSTRWRKGQASPNPAGRPKKTMLTDALRDVLAEQYPGDKQGRTFAEVIARRLATDAAKGSLRAVAEIARTEDRVRAENELRRTRDQMTLPPLETPKGKDAYEDLVAITERIRERIAIRKSWEAQGTEGQD